MDTLGHAPGGRKDRPWLLPSNRKLRHLQGISVRNLSVTSPVTRARGKTIDDHDLPYALQSPTKRLAQSEGRALQHSRSFTDLASPTKKVSKLDLEAPTTKNVESMKRTSTGPGKDGESVSKPSLVKLRRRSTLHWSGASPAARQEKLEDLAATRMADTWFSIHCKGVDGPVYVSEIMDRSMNQTFRSFDLHSSGPIVTRQDELTLRLWAKSASMDEFALLLELNLNLRSLQYIGKTLENFRHPMPVNCVLFHLSDGIYTNFTDLPAEEHGVSFLPQEQATGKPGDVQNTSSYDALMQLANLDDCVQDALATRGKLEEQINSLLESTEHSRAFIQKLSQAEEQFASAKRACAAGRRQIRQATRRRDELKESLRIRRQAMNSDRQSQAEAKAHMSSVESALEKTRTDIKRNSEDSAGQIRRICEDLLRIYPIEPIPGKSLAFTIRGIFLPNSSFDDINRVEVAAALGYTSQLVYLLSFYLSVPLPYPLHSYSSTSYIQDPISMSITQRTYPLHPTSIQYRFEYGVFLLNKDIEFLMSSQGLRMLDIRHSLPNLKYLLYVLTAGSGELPTRKAGGIRGLIAGRATPSVSRRGSEDSVLSVGGFVPSKPLDGLVKANGGAVKGKGPEGTNDELAKVSFRSSTLPYRTSGLREAS